ncbi:MAG: uracil-DNA glycosylase, partial [Candidatus Omnitrophica bacterium]|nr:uracil-DNA glycosylase [Candidatus Omnitrophota bacterium]
MKSRHQLDAIKIKKTAAQTLLKTQDPISRLRGRFLDFNGFKLLRTFVAAYLLRTPA